MHGNPIPSSVLPDPTAPGGPDSVFVTPGQNGSPGTVRVVRDGRNQSLLKPIGRCSSSTTVPFDQKFDVAFEL
jgi:hypothetical protein